MNINQYPLPKDEFTVNWPHPLIADQTWVGTVSMANELIPI